MPEFSRITFSSGLSGGFRSQIFGSSIRPNSDTSNGFSIFPSLYDRTRVSTIANNLASYIEDNDIANLIILDRAARPAYQAVRAVWNHKYPGEALPFQVYFMNPRGFLTPSDLMATSKGVTRLDQEIIKGSMNDDRPDIAKAGRNQASIESELQSKKYSRLMASKDNPTLVYDNCIHFGSSISPILRVLESLQFSDVRVGVASERSNSSGIVPDFVGLTDINDPACSVFGREGTIIKTFDSVHSSANRRGFNEGYQQRQELKVAAVDPIDGQFEMSSDMQNRGDLDRVMSLLSLLAGQQRSILIREPFGGLPTPERIFAIPDITLQALKNSFIKDGRSPMIVEAYGCLQELGLNSARDAVDAIKAGNVSPNLLEKIVLTDGPGNTIAPAIIAAARQALQR